MKKPVELMRLIRVPPDGKMTIEVRGKRFDHLSEIPDERVRSVLQHAIYALLDDVCNEEDLAQIGFQKIEPRPAELELSSPVAEEEKPIPGLDDVADGPASDEIDEAKRAAFLASLEQGRDAQFLQSSQPERPRSLLSRFRSKPKEPEPAQPSRLPVLNIAGQIHQLVQEEKSKFPELAQRDITIQQNIDSGLRIIVDSEVFQDVAEIHDPQIRMVIKNAIRAWENLN